MPACQVRIKGEGKGGGSPGWRIYFDPPLFCSSNAGTDWAAAFGNERQCNELTLLYITAAALSDI